MKTTMNKKSLKAYRGEYLNMEAEVARRRKQYQSMAAQVKDEENLILEKMFSTAANLFKVLGREPTAHEITVAMGGDMSQQEVVGQLLVAAGEHFNGASYPRPTTRATHSATQSRKGQVKIDRILTTRKFAEVDAEGKVIEGGRVLKFQSCRNGYRVEG